MSVKPVSVYVEHAKKDLQDIACDMLGWESTFNGPSGSYHNFDTIEHALMFVWMIRRRPTRYVEISELYKHDLQEFAKKRGYNLYQTLVQKFTK
jgi:hypothetical protein